MDLLWLAAAVPALLALVMLLLAVNALFRRRVAVGVTQVLSAIVLLSLAAVFGLVAVGMNGYRVFTAERTAARVEVVQHDEQRFTARFTFPDGEREEFEIAGDELYVDARILRWHPRANLLGLQTGYQLDRVAGRYQSLDDEETSPRTVYSLAREGPVDLFDMARDYRLLSRLVDAEYGSATFMQIEHGDTYEVRVSNSGLLIRETVAPD